VTGPSAPDVPDASPRTDSAPSSAPSSAPVPDRRQQPAPVPDQEQPLRAPRVVLVGPPGGGKSTVGAVVAERLEVPFVDTDTLVAERGGAPVGELMVDLGEEGFRALEGEVVTDALGTDGVLALGSGAVEAAIPLLERYARAGGSVVLLDVSMSAGVPRVGLNVPRSVALGSARAQFAAMAAARRPVYERVAGTVVDTSSLTVEQVAEEVLAAIAG
jgi:shikimate kinase